MLGARSIAVVGASDRPGSFGERMVAEVDPEPVAAARRASGQPALRRDRRSAMLCARWPTSTSLSTWSCSGSRTQRSRSSFGLAAARGDRSAVIFGSVVGSASDGSPLRERVAAIARDAGMAVCGGGCMGFVHVVNGIRAHRLPRARPDPGRTGRPGHPLGLGVLGAAAHPAPDRLPARGVLRPGAGHRRPPTTSSTPSTCPRRGSSRCCWRRSATARGSCWRCGERPRSGVPVVLLRGRRLADGPGDGGRPLRRRRRRGRGMGGAVRGNRRPTGTRPRRVRRHPRAVRHRTPSGGGRTRRRDRHGARLRRRAHAARRRRRTSWAFRSRPSPQLPRSGWPDCSTAVSRR